MIVESKGEGRDSALILSWELRDAFPNEQESEAERTRKRLDVSRNRRWRGKRRRRDARPLTTIRVRARPDPFLVICRCFSVFTIAAAIICVAVNGISAARSFENASDIFGGIFRCYAILIAILVAVAETEWGFIFKFWRILEYWAGRGMLQIFVAVMTRAYSESTGEKHVLVMLQEIGSYMLLACGVIYVLSGILCIGFVKRSRLHKELTREQAAKHLEELESRREQLRAFLVERV